MENKQKNPRRRLNSLILLVAFTAVMLIVSTYAWFSAQKNVTISNLEGKVNVAEGLMVSLDAKSWSQEVDFEDYDQNAVGANGAASYKAALSEPVTADTTNDLYVRNNIPKELVPVSTTGTEKATWAIAGDKSTGTGAQELTFYNGVNVEGIELHSISETNFTETDATKVAFPGYYAIDIFLQNSSKIDTDGADNDASTTADNEVQGTTKETLQLNTNSVLQLVTGGSTLTGLQNTVRVALAMYSPVAGADLTTSDASKVSSAYVTASQSQILNAYKGATISDVAIWEPNADQHVETIVNTNNRIMVKPTGKLDTLYFTNAADTNNSNIAKFAAGDILPTFALTANSKSVADTLSDRTKTGIKNIYDWQCTDANEVTATAGGFKRQIALQTKKSTNDYSISTGGVRNLISVSSTGEAIYEMGDKTPTAQSGYNETGAVEFQMLKNTVVKCRLYMWLEGQDVDCINFASHGSGVHLDLGLVKGQKPGDAATS